MEERAKIPLCKLTSRFSRSPTRAGMKDALRRTLTGDEEVDGVLWSFAKYTLLLLGDKESRA